MSIYLPAHKSARKQYKLMVKTHLITGWQYLCITGRDDPHDYLGSGIDWRKHLEEHGNLITTRIIATSWNPDTIGVWGRYYSRLWKVVRSKKWANITPESGYHWPDNSGWAVVRDVSGDVYRIRAEDWDLYGEDIVGAQKGTTTVYDADGKSLRISCEEFKNRRGELNGVCLGKMAAIDSDGNYCQVDVDDPRRLSGEIRHPRKGRVDVVVKATGLREFVSCDDPRIEKGEVEYVEKGFMVKGFKVAVDANTSENLGLVSEDDPRWATGEICDPMKNKAHAYDAITGEYLGPISCDDIRWKRKEIRGQNFGKKLVRKKQFELVTCPHCGKQGKGGNMKRYHFDECSFNPEKINTV